MKKTKFTEQQIVFALKQAENGVKIDEISRKMGISEATYYNWKMYVVKRIWTLAVEVKT